MFFLFSKLCFSSLVGYWKIDEGKGDKALDYSGNFLGGKIINATFEKTEKGIALNFSQEKKSYVEIPDGEWNIKEGSVTFLFWVKSTGSCNAIIEHAHTGSLPGSFTIIDWGKLGFSVYDDNSKEKTVFFKNFKRNEWQFIGIIWKKSKDGYIKIFLNGEEEDKIDVSCTTKVSGKLYLGARGEVPDQFMNGYLKEVMIFNRELKNEEIKDIYNGKPVIEEPVTIGYIEVDKIFYNMGEKLFYQAVIRNLTSESRKVKMDVNTIFFMNERKNYKSEELTLKPEEIKEINGEIKLQEEKYGVALEISVKDRNIEKKAYTYFSVSDNFWNVSIGATGGGILFGTGNHKLESVKKVIEEFKSNYFNWYEIDFWAPDDWGYLTPKEEEWISGQAARYYNKSILKALIEEGHKYGIKAITYGKGTAAAPWGLEIARRNPEWFLNGLDGLEMWGYYDVWQIENWNNYLPNSEERKKYFNTNWMPLFPNFRNVEALDFGINELINSISEYKWDGVRFDGQFSVSDPLKKPEKDDDEFSTFNMQRMKEKIWEKFPDFLFGYNWSYHPREFYDDIRKEYLHEMEESLAGGGLYMQEAINTFTYGYGRQYKKWSEYDANEADASDIVREKGGVYQYIYNIRNYKPSTRLYKFVIGTSNGTHQAYGDHIFVPGCSNWGKFLTRWSFLFWADEIKRIKNPAEFFEVSNKENKEIWWENKVYQIILRKDLKYIVIHMINPPTIDEIGKEEMPESIKDIEVYLNLKGERIKEVYFVSPDLLTNDFTMKITNRYGKVKIPELKVWGIVVFEITGTKPYELPVKKEKFTKKAEVNKEIANKKYEEFMKGIRENKKKGISFWRAVDRGWNSRFAIGNDIEASGGVCAIVDYKMGGGTMYAAYYPEKWGFYKATWRIKVVDVNEDINIVLRATPSKKSEIKENYAEKKLKLSDFKSIGKYEEFSLEFGHIRKPGFYTALTVGIGNCKKGTVYVDTVKVEPIRTFSDKELGDIYFSDIKIEEMNLPDKKGGINILVLRGYWWKNYRIENVVNEIGNERIKRFDVYPDPTKEPYNISDYNIIFLINYPIGFDNYNFRSKLLSFVKSGGKLIILGGMYCLGQGGLKDTIVEEILPVKLTGVGELIRAEKPLILSLQKNNFLPEKPAIYYYHNVIPREDSKVILYGGEIPVLLQKNYGKGEVIVFIGTVLGEKKVDETPFWETNEWKKVMKSLIKED